MSRHHKKAGNKKKTKYKNQTLDNEQEMEKEIKAPILEHQKIEQTINQSQKAQTSESFKFQKSRVPHKIIVHSEVVQDERLGLRQQAKKIKKIFFDICQEAERFSVQIRRANFFPTVFLEFKASTLQTKQYVFLRDIIKQSKDAFKEHKEKVHCIYSCLFDAVPSHFSRLAIFGILKSKDLKIRLSYKIRKEHEGSDLSLYYTWDKSRRDVNFALIDKNLTIVDFSGSNIFVHQEHEEEVNLYQQFLQYLNNPGPSTIDFEEIQETPIFDEVLQQSSAELFNKLTQYLKKNLRVYEDECLEKEEQILNLWADNNSADDVSFIQMLNNQITLMREGIQNYAQIVVETQQTIKNKNLSNYQCNAYLKRLMMAEKEITSKLPILLKKQQIFDMLTNQSIILIEGETGSGKSTQIPQLLTQHFRLFELPDSKPVLVSQPRRLATRTLAERVASELGEKIGKFVDYKSSIDKQVSIEAKIVFKLDRMVLDELTQDRLLSSYSCLVIDEAHERTISIDVIAGLIKDLVKARPDFKVIITSASMDVGLFQKYFDGIKALRVSGRLHDVNVLYRETEGESTLEKIKKVLNEQIIQENSSLRDPFSGHVLVFCHGVDEINQLTQYYQAFLNPNRFEVYPLHGKILPQEQRKAFNSTKKHKIIFASRIAETAITIDDVRVVVDPGEDYELVYNQKLKFSSMKLRPISQSSAKQRAGRAGRTSPGFCFRLYSLESFMSRPLGKVPQMENSSLDTVVLRLKSLGIDNLFTFSYISPPDKQGIQTSIETLKIVEALDKNEDITGIGEILLLVPIEPILGRSLIEAVFIEHVLKSENFMINHMRQMSEEEKQKMSGGGIRNSVVEILSMVINSSSLFMVSQNRKNQSNLNKFTNFPLREGDFFLLKSLYQQYKLIYETLGERSQLKFWLNHFFINKKALRQVRQLEKQINKLLIDYIRLDFQQLEDEISAVKYKLRFCKTYNDVVLLCLVTSFVPQLCRYSGNPQIGYTLISERKPIQIYGSSSLSLVGLTPNSPPWILAYDLYTSERGRFYCKIAQQIDIDFLEKVIGNYAWGKFNLKNAKLANPYYQKIEEECLSTKIYNFVKDSYIHRQRNQKEPNVVLDSCTLLFNDESSKITVFVLKDLASLQEINIQEEYHSYLKKVEQKFEQGGFFYAYFGTTKITFTNDFVVSNVEKMIQSDIIISGLSPSQYSILKEHLKKYSGVKVISRMNWIKVQLQEESSKKQFDFQLQSFINDNFSGSKVQIKRIPRNERRISQSKVLMNFKVENILHKVGQKNIEKYYNLLREIINGEKDECTLKRPQEWKQDIEGLLIRANINPEECAINIWKNEPTSRKKQPFVDMFAQISTIEGGVYKKLIQLQEANQHLGCQSLHIREVFQQILAFLSEKAFISLKEEFIQIIINLKTKFKGFNIVEKYLRLGSKVRVKIIGKSWARQQLWEASKAIGSLFYQRQIVLSRRQAYFLQHVDKFNILQKLENEYKYTIALEVDNGKLYAYCKDQIFEELVDKLKHYLSSSQYVTKEISYKNKSLADMIDIIKARKEFLVNNTLKTVNIEYEIRFDKKIIILTALEREHDILRAEFQRISYSIKNQCIICNNRVSSSYCLIKCRHNACRECLSAYLQQNHSDNNLPIACPHPECKKTINIYDIEGIVGKSKFQNWCDQRIIKYAQTTLKMQTCQRCQIIVWEENNESNQCSFCGYVKEENKSQRHN